MAVTFPITKEAFEKAKAEGRTDVFCGTLYGAEMYYTRAYEGFVVADREHNGYHDSDFYAVVFDPAKGEPFEVEYATTRFGGGGSCEIDASPAVEAAYRAWWGAREKATRKASLEADAKTVARGKTVKVVKGRKVPKGTVGKVIWVGEPVYYGHRPTVKVGIATSDEREASGRYKDVVWTDISNCEVVNWEEFMAA